MNKVRFRKMDSFVYKGSSGNPAGYVNIGNEMLSEEKMQKIAFELKITSAWAEPGDCVKPTPTTMASFTITAPTAGLGLVYPNASSARERACFI